MKIPYIENNKVLIIVCIFFPQLLLNKKNEMNSNAIAVGMSQTLNFKEKIFP